MYDLDHMLGGKGSRQHHQDLIRETQRYKLACDARNAQRNDKAVASLRLILTAIINLIVR
jgi:hypothetical protein